LASFTVDEVLSQLDQAASDSRFPMLDNGYYYPVDQRLHAFGDSTRWAMVIETLGYNPRAGNLIDVLEKFGNCVGTAGAENDDFLSRLDNYKELWDLEGKGRPWTDTTGLVVRGTRVPFRAGLPANLEPWDLLREVVPRDRLLFLATEAELRKRIPSDLPRLLLLEDWHHPDLLKGEKPSASETFQMIAAVLVSADPSRYSPRLQPNSHWSNWPEGGTL